jgi:regulator of sigma D
MIFKQYKDGSCDIEFSEEEIKILNKKRKLHLSNENLKHFGNHMVKIVSDWHLNFNKEILDKKTRETTEIKSS